jgi:orotidine-5'-phosphate decarboxylase
MHRETLVAEIQRKRSFLCIGLDSDIHKIPRHLLDFEDPVAEFNRQIIAATHDLCVAYKPNIAFYEVYGPKGWETLHKTLSYIPGECFTIADAKRADIGNTSDMYARTFFDTYGFDSITLHPYMGRDSVEPFLKHDGKWSIILAMTSNSGSADFQFSNTDGIPLYEKVLRTAMTWGSAKNTMFVIGATHGEMFAEVRRICPDHFLLVPGIGAQGGDLHAVVKNGINKDVGLLVNSARGIIYASSGEDFAERAREEAHKLQQEMDVLMERFL